MLPTYQRMNPTSSRKTWGVKSPEKLLILLVVACLSFVFFGAFFLLPDNFGQDKVSRLYRHFKEAPEIFLPAPPIRRHNSGDSTSNSENSPLHYDDIHLIGDRSKLKDKINSELGHDILEKPETAKIERSRERQAVENGNNVLQAPKTSPAVPAFVRDAVSSLENQIVHSDDLDATARERREKVKEVSRIVLISFKLWTYYYFYSNFFLPNSL